ncbi:Cytochrome c oxidase assembly protein cox20, mitochondrial [Blyttiomyces sp. JEL0837]|nr:Cytochrome c oxidase assembly protein cox20, mitochondrial [Blyttiomyces sp. JEL0837]
MADSSSTSSSNSSSTATLSSASRPFDPTKPPNVVDALQSVQLRDFKLDNIAKLPCARNALLYGISSGLGLGIIRFAVKRNIRSSGNWAVIGFAGTAVASWEVCRLQRRVVQDQLQQMSASSNTAK